MQQQIGQIEESTTKTQEKLCAAEEERDRSIKELRETKKVAEQANNTRHSDSRKVADIDTELNKVKRSLGTANQELKIKEMNIKSLKLELENAKEKDDDASLNKQKEDLSNAKSSEAKALSLLSESKRRIQELESEIEKGKESETKMLDSFVSQTKQLEQTKISLEESKLEIKSLRKKLEAPTSGGKSDDLSKSQSQFLDGDNLSIEEELKSLKAELQLAKENLARAKEAEQLSSLNASCLLEEMSLLKNELKLATEVEENNKKAMDDLALALKEVATDCNQVKEKLTITQAELESAKEEAEELRGKLISNEEDHKALLQEARKAADQYKNTAERLRFEAEESILAWNGKEAGFVGYIKRVEEERDAALEENNRLLQSLVTAENLSRKAKEENYKLRDILKQALNEANVAKEAAGIARAENSQLKDAIAEKENALNFLSRENENLKINEAAASENMNELKRLVYEASAIEVKTKNKKQGGELSNQNSMDKEQQHKDHDKKLGKTSSFNLKEIKIPHKPKEADEDIIPPRVPSESHDDEDEDSAKAADPLKGSIFDDMAESPDCVATHHRKKSSSAFTDDGETLNSDDYDHLDGARFDDTESDRNSRKKKALLRRLGDLVRRKTFYKKELSLE